MKQQTSLFEGRRFVEARSVHINPRRIKGEDFGPSKNGGNFSFVKQNAEISAGSYLGRVYYPYPTSQIRISLIFMHAF